MDEKNINENNNIKEKNKDIKNIIERFKNFEFLFRTYFWKIQSINNFYKNFSSNKNIDDKTIACICNELREPILFQLAVFLRSYIDDFQKLFRLLKNNKKLVKLIECKIREKNKRIEEKFINISFWDPKIMNPGSEEFKNFRVKFYNFIWNFLKQNKEEKIKFEQIKGVLNVICHYYEKDNHKKDKEKNNQYNEKLYSWILNEKEFQENFFEFIHWLDYVVSGKEEAISSEIFKKDLIVIKKLTKYFNNWLKEQENIKICLDELKNNK